MELSRKIARLGRRAPPMPSSSSSGRATPRHAAEGRPGAERRAGDALDDPVRDLSTDEPHGARLEAGSCGGPPVPTSSAAGLVLERPPAVVDARERARQARIAHLRSLIVDFEARAWARAEAARAEREAAWAVNGGPPELPGERLETPSGPVRVAEHQLPPEHCHGRVAVRRGLSAQPELLARLAFDATLSGIDPAGALFLDTETTGLTGGTGTIPFLIGYARFEDGALKLYQLFLEAPGEEGPMLERLREAVEACSVLVTYNGKSYDWPLLATRFVMNRVPPPPPRPHLDLLHVARRLYRLRLGSAKLVKMEEEILGMRRERDIDGGEIPGVYWSYLRHKDPTQVAAVMEHNANDLVALAALMGVVSERYAELHVHDDPLDHLCLARTAVRADDPDKAFEFARAAAEGGGAPEITVQASLLVAELLKKRRDWAGAVRALEDAVEAAGADRLLAAPAHLMLAKLHEHRTKDLDRALAHAAHTEPEEGADAQARRVERIRGRQARRAEAAARAARRAAREGARQRRSVAALARSVVLPTPT